jgi:sorbitol-specific phosphotransferase system component IIA
MNINLQFVAVATGTVNAITATYAPVPLALMDRMMVLFRATGANTITTPTFNPNNLGAKVIVKKGGVALAVGDITGAGFVGHLVYDATNERWELLNPGASSGGGGGSVNSVTDDANGVVSVDNTDPSNPVIEFNGVNVDGITMSGDGTSGNPLVATGGILKGTASGTDTYTTTITGVTAYNDGDAYLIRFGNGNTTGCTLNINSLGAISLYRNNDGELIGGDITDGAEMFCIYNSIANTFQVIGTAPNTLLAYVTNDDSVTITKGQPVYAFSGTGDRLTVKLASNTTDATSAQTVGLVLSTSIAANQKGLIIVNGLLDGLSTLPTSTFSDGDAIYLGATAGTITKVKPSAPNHLVYLGFVTTASNGNAGRMYVRVQNGYELDEIHDVKIATPLNNQGIFYNNSNTLWENKAVISALSGTKSEFDTACSDGNFVFQSDALGTPSSGTLTNCNGLVESGLTLSDNTTNDVSTTKHGFVPKAPNDTTKFLRGDGTWSVVNNNGGWTIIVKSANQDVTNSATLTDDTDLQFSVVAGGHYMLELDLVISANNITGDYKNAFFVSAGTMLGTGFMIGPTATGTAQVNIYSSNTVATSTSVILGTQTANIDLLASTKIIYSFQASANATLSYQFANNAAAAGRTSRTWKGSILKYKRID